MVNLPSGYIPMNYIGTSSSAYIDTGIYPSNTLEIEGKFSFGWQDDVSVYLFGSRNTNSNTSAGQLELECVNGKPYLGYYNTRQAIGVGMKYYTKKTDNIFSFYSSTFLNNIEGNSSAFTGTRTMYLMARNNGGTAQQGTPISGRGIYALKISDNGTVLKEYVPVCLNGAYGIYEAVSGTFTTFTNISPNVLFQVNSNGGGEAYIETDNCGNTDKIYVTYSSQSLFSAFQDNTVLIHAKPSKGYEFLHWTKNGNILSADRDMSYDVTEAQTLTAVFVKKTDMVQNNGFQALGLEYGIATASGSYSGLSSNIYAKVRSAKIVEDMMAKSTSTIIVDSVPSLYQSNMPLILLNSKGKQIYCGSIKSIKENEIICREPLSVTDADTVIEPTPLLSNANIIRYTASIVGGFLAGYPKIDWTNGTGTTPIQINWFLNRLGRPYIVGEENYIYFSEDRNYMVNAPVVEGTSVKSLEDYLFELANQFMIHFKASLVTDSSTKKTRVMLTSANTFAQTKIAFGNNIEDISDVTVEVEEAEANVLEVFASSGDTVRGIYGAKTDGTIKKMPDAFADIDSNFLAYTNCKLKTVCSDDSIITLKAQYLSSAFFNHKITFIVDLSKGNFTLDDLQLGRRVSFYYGNKMYESLITAREYEINENIDDIKSVKLTLGKVRNTLTSKLNLGKTK